MFNFLKRKKINRAEFAKLSMIVAVARLLGVKPDVLRKAMRDNLANVSYLEEMSNEDNR